MIRVYSVADNPNILTMFAQKVNDAYPWGTGHTDIFSRNPSDLDSDDTLDYYEVTGMTNTDEEVKITKKFVHADLNPLPYVTKPFKAIAQIAIAKGTGNSYCTKVVFTAGLMQEDGTFVSKLVATATPNVSTDSTSYQFLSAQAFFPTSPAYEIKAIERFCLQMDVWGKVAAGNGKIKLMISRGSGDSFVDLYKR
ncbi:MAG: hypothetical protein KAU20_05870 [Nanoarchaeota archaeon]|nr:hypothetical protein [Nanoarchaeota archaeon]